MEPRTPAESERRLSLAEQLLSEAVYRSRGLQAVRVGLAGAPGASGPRAPGAEGVGNCGLGEAAAVDLDLTERGQELFDELWPQGVAASQAELLRGTMADWVELQDALDRKRNHFIRDFRRTHGADRREYAPEVARAYEDGLEAVNREVRQGCRRAAEDLLGA